MSTTIFIPSSLQQIAQAPAEIRVIGSTIQEVINGIQQDFPLLHSKLVKNGQLQDFVNIYIDDIDIRSLNGLSTPINNSSSIRIITAIAGG